MRVRPSVQVSEKGEPGSPWNEERSQKVQGFSQGLETLWLLTSWNFEGRIVRKMGEVCEPIDEPAKGGGYGLTEQERILQENLALIRGFRPIDDDFMRKIFKDNKALTQVVLRIILGKNDLIVDAVKTQDDLKKLLGARSLELDVHGWDAEKKQFFM